MQWHDYVACAKSSLPCLLTWVVVAVVGWVEGLAADWAAAVAGGWVAVGVGAGKAEESAAAMRALQGRTAGFDDVLPGTLVVLCEISIEHPVGDPTRRCSTALVVAPVPFCLPQEGSTFLAFPAGHHGSQAGSPRVALELPACSSRTRMPGCRHACVASVQCSDQLQGSPVKRRWPAARTCVQVYDKCGMFTEHCIVRTHTDTHRGCREQRPVHCSLQLLVTTCRQAPPPGPTPRWHT